MHPRLFHLGPFTLPTYGLFAAIALIAGLTLATYTARRLRLAPNRVWNLGVIIVFGAAIGSRLLLLAENWRDFLHYPLLMMTVTTPDTIASFLVELALGIFAGLFYMTIRNMPWLTTLDAVAPAWALGQAILAVGCLLAGCNYGTPTTMPWGIAFHSPWAALWNGTPLGITLHPVQLYLFVVELALCLGLLWWLPRRRQAGDLAGAWLLISGLAQFFLDFYRAGNRLPIFGGALSLVQAIGFGMVVLGALLLLSRRGSRSPQTQPAEVRT